MNNGSSWRWAVSLIVTVAVVGGVIWWLTIGNQTPTQHQPSPPNATSSPTAQDGPSDEVLPVNKEDMSAAQEATRTVLRAYFSSPKPGEDQLEPLYDLTTYRLQREIKEQWTGLGSGVSSVVDQISVSDYVLPHEARQIVLLAEVSWTVNYGNETSPETNISTATVTLVKDGGWRVDTVQERDGPIETDEEE